MDPTASDPATPNSAASKPAAPEPTAETRESIARPLPENIWLHGLILLVMIVLTRIAQALTSLCAVLQFFWMLFKKERNVAIAEFGDGLANWLGIAARFMSGRADKRPFPWTSWK
jgi:hypothetical protein